MNRSSLGIHQFNQAVGAVVVLCVVLFAGALVNAGLLKEWFQASLTLRIVLPEAGVSGLAQGAEVQVLGTRAGEIRRIVIEPSQRMHAELRIDRQMQPFIRRDSQVVIRRQFGIAGASYVDISRGHGAELDWGFAVLNAGTERGPTDNIGQLIEQVQARFLPLLDEMHKVIANANAVVDKAGPLQQTLQSAATLTQRLERGEGALGKFLADDKMVADLQAALAAAQSAMTHANGLMAELERTSKDARLPGMVQRTDEILASLQTLSKNLASASPRVGKLTDSVTATADSMPALLLQTETTARELEFLLGQLRHHWLLGGSSAPATPASRRAPAGEVRP
ncbi:MAG: MCE family protein [Reyranella sp.]|uniref:MlaD family protein n=1 Tax=Reyranella sp. TaxID=1929291 RepID=UPI001ACA0169|nr:MlaD family protein [Reyranella sp.]MBN9089963.1 MCE family protein [Reyranella sp.]